MVLQEGHESRRRQIGAWRTATFPRWIVFSGFVCALVLLLVISHWLWIAMLFPLWTILISVYILTAKREPHD